MPKALCPSCHRTTQRIETHDCSAAERKSLFQKSAYLGDSLLRLRTATWLAHFERHTRPDYLNYFNSARHQALYLRAYYPESEIFHRPVPASEHSVSTYFEAAYWEDPLFRRVYQFLVFDSHPDTARHALTKQ